MSTPATPPGSALAVVGLVVKDMATSLAFYRQLGMAIPDDAEAAPHVDVQLPGGLRMSWDTESTIRSFDPDWMPGTGGHRIALAFDCGTSARVDDLYAQMTAAGYDGHKSPWDAIWQQRYAVLHDPDGNQVELFAPLRT